MAATYKVKATLFECKGNVETPIDESDVEFDDRATAQEFMQEVEALMDEISEDGDEDDDEIEDEE